MQLPLGYDNFKKIIDKKLDFVDKSLFIKEILDDRSTEAAVITRPRRFGKTLNLSMLHHFLAAEVNGQSTKGLFDGLKIESLGDEYLSHQGRYPVIFMTFKSVKDGGFERALQKIAMLMAEVYKEHRYLLTSSKLNEEDKTFYQAILSEKADQSMLEMALKKLTAYLYQHHGVKPWLLIDDYDTPLRSAYLHGYYRNMFDYIVYSFGSVLKTNPYLNRAVMTGVLRTPKNDSLNNLYLCPLTDSHHYAQHFGLTKEEVRDLLQKAGLEPQAQTVFNGYDGYRIGKCTVYNSESIVNSIQAQGGLMANDWMDVDENQLISECLIRASMTCSSTLFKTELATLCRRESLEKIIDVNVEWGDLKNNSSALWSVLTMAGYLKIVDQRQSDIHLYCTLSLPNRESKELFARFLKQLNVQTELEIKA